MSQSTCLISLSKSGIRITIPATVNSSPPGVAIVAVIDAGSPTDPTQYAKAINTKLSTAKSGRSSVVRVADSVPVAGSDFDADCGSWLFCSSSNPSRISVRTASDLDVIELDSRYSSNWSTSSLSSSTCAEKVVVDIPIDTYQLQDKKYCCSYCIFCS